MDEFEFPTLPTAEELAALSDDDLAALERAFREAYAEAAALAASPADVARLTEVVEQIESLATEATRRETEAAEVQAGLDALASRINPADPTAETDDPAGDLPAEGDDPPAGDEPVADPSAAPAEGDPPAADPAVDTPEAIAAAAAVAEGDTPTLADINGRTPAAQRPRVPAQARRGGFGRTTITAGADLRGIRPGQRFESMRSIAEAMSERHRYLGKGEADDRVPVAHFELAIPEARRLTSDMSWRETLRAIGVAEPVVAAATGQAYNAQGIQAAGGLCAPTAGYYEQMVVAEAMRPVRDALANFGADRGGIRFNPPPHLADITSGVAVQTAAQDAAGTPSKGCFHIGCNSIQEVVIDAIYSCLEFGNFGARTFPEAVEAWTRLALALHARVAETHLLDGIAAASTAVTSAGLVGGAREVVARLGQAGAVMRNNNRTDPELRIRALLPAWVLDLCQSDNARTFTDNPGFIGASDDEIIGWLRSRGIEPSFYVDTKTGGGQQIALEAGGVLNEYPSTALVYMFFEGSFLHLDGGVLDLGIVRDTTTNAANNFRVFSETFENVAFVGPQSLEVALTLCPDGSVGATRSVTCPIVT